MLPAGYPAECERRAATRSGIEYLIRPIRPDDLEREYEFVRGLSEQTLYNRLMYAVQEPTDALLKPLVNIDYQRHMALIALMPVPDATGGAQRERIVGVARYAVDAADRQHEFAVVVADEWQGHGIGTTLLRNLFEYARGRGLRRLVGTVFPSNERMLSLARRLGLEVRTSEDDASLIALSQDFTGPA